MLNNQLERDIETISTFVYDTPVMEVFGRIKKFIEEAQNTSTNKQMDAILLDDVESELGIFVEHRKYMPNHKFIRVFMQQLRIVAQNSTRL